MLKSQYNNVIFAVDDFFLYKIPKHCNTGGRNEWTVAGIMSKNKFHFYESILASL